MSGTIRKRIWNKGKPNERECWIVDYRDQQSRRHIKSFPTKKAATDWSVTALHEVKEGIHTAASSSITVDDLGKLWVADTEANRREISTVKQQQLHLRRHIGPYLGRDKLASLTLPRLVAFDDTLRDNGRSVAMRRKVLTSLSSMLTFAQRRGLVAQNVARGHKIKRDKRAEGSAQPKVGEDFPTLSEVKLILDNAPARWRPLFVTATFTGLRISELRALRWSDVEMDVPSPRLRVRQRASNFKQAQIGNPKSQAAYREVPLSPMVVNTLRQWRRDCPIGPMDLVFPDDRGEVQSYFSLRETVWRPLQVRLGITRSERDKAGKEVPIPKYGFHALRHVAASLFIEHSGWSAKRLQTVMGHSSIQLTYDTYGHLLSARDDTDDEAMKRIEAAVSVA